jgi:AcrR family transcriptional regulator
MGIKERREREREMRQQQILDAAKKVFSVKGFRSATMEDIAREAELSPGALYTYFNKKDDLFASLNIRVLEALIDRAEALRGRTDIGPAEKIPEMMEIYLDVYESEPLIFASLFNLQCGKDFWNLSDEIYTKINRLAETSCRATAGIIEDAIREKTLMDFHPMALTDIIWGLFSGLVLWDESKRLTNPRKEFLKETARLGARILLRGLQKQA